MSDSSAYLSLCPSFSLCLSPQRLVLWSDLSNGCQCSYLHWRWKHHTNCSWHDMAGVKWQRVSCQAGTGPSPELGQRCLVSASDFLIMLTSYCQVALRSSQCSAGWMRGAERCWTSLRLFRDINALQKLPAHNWRSTDGYFSPFIWYGKMIIMINESQISEISDLSESRPCDNII